MDSSTSIKNDAKTTPLALEETSKTGTDEGSSHAESTCDESRFTSKDFKVCGSPVGKGMFDKEVYKVEHKLDPYKIYAVKQIPLNSETEPEATREVEVLSKLKHSNVVRYHCSWKDGSKLAAESKCSGSSQSLPSPVEEEKNSSEISDCDGATSSSQSTPPMEYMKIQMEFCENDLSDLIEGTKLKDMEQIWQLFREIVDGLVYIHEQNVIHGDLQSSNIFLDANNHVKIGDFGQAEYMNVIHGDPQSPNILLDANNDQIADLGQADMKHDMFGLGMILFQMCESYQKRNGGNMGFLEHERTICPLSFGKQEREIIDRLVGSKSKRPSSKEMQQELEELLDSAISDPSSKEYKRDGCLISGKKTLA